jgi:hypothetical protein
MFDLAKKFLQHVMPGVVRPLHVLWNEIIGFMFLCFSVLLLRPLWKSYREFNGEAEALFKLALTAIFFLTMFFFGVQSFFKARRIARKK